VHCERASEPLPLEQAGATPVRTGGNMSLEAQLNQPAFTYFVWLDAAGNVLPLYPWNSQTLEVKDLRQPRPEREHRGGREAQGGCHKRSRWHSGRM